MGLFSGKDEGDALVENCTTLSEIPGRRITRSLGLVEYTRKDLGGNVPNSIEKTILNLVASAREQGANAVVNVRLVTGTYERFGTNLLGGYILAYGDAVVVE